MVIFQEELRQIFERIAVWRLTSKNDPSLRSDAADILVKTVADLAKDKIGALIVVEGKNPIGRHIMGGIELGGKISEPLLKSIFDPHSPGHDGAVIIENDQIARFAAHLPLSKDFQQLAHVGTRHSAALGLAELSDAMCIAVSEERGKISVARNGRLRQVDNMQELGALLQKFLHEKYPSEENRRLSFSLVRENWLTKVVTFFLAIGLWYVLVPGSRTVEATFKIPVQVENLPPNLRVENIQPPEINATFTGPKADLLFFRCRQTQGLPRFIHSRRGPQGLAPYRTKHSPSAQFDAPTTQSDNDSDFVGKVAAPGKRQRLNTVTA